MKQVSPGVFFALFGVAAIAVAVARPIHVSIPAPRATTAVSSLADGVARSNPCADSESITGKGPKYNKMDDVKQH